MYSIGEEVLALWKQNRKYPATILDIQGEGGYLVRFYDGYEKVVRAQCIRRVGKGDLEFVTQCKDQLITENGTDKESPAGDCETSKVRRERKSKFNVREILNLKESSPKKGGLKNDLVSLKMPAESSEEDMKASYERSDKVFDNSKELIVRKEDLDATEECKQALNEGSGKVIEIVDLSETLECKGETSVSETGSEGTPSEKENICDMEKIKNRSKPTTRDPSATSSSAEVSTKRTRKRKKFADEELDSKVTKVQKKNPIHTSILKSKSHRVPTKVECVVSQTSNKCSDLSKKRAYEKTESEGGKTKFEGSIKVASKLHKSSQKPTLDDNIYEYLNFDFSLPTDKLQSKFIEGVNIPGAKKPVLVRSPKLPAGWVKKVTLRTKGNFKWDVLIENSDGRSFKSRAELSRYFEENNIDHNMEHFDFALDTPLKKIRQLWRASLPQTEKRNADLKVRGVNGVTDVHDDPLINERLHQNNVVKATESPISPPFTSKKTDGLSIRIPPKQHPPSSEEYSGPDQVHTTSNGKHLGSPNSPLKGTSSETGQVQLISPFNPLKFFQMGITISYFTGC